MIIPWRLWWNVNDCECSTNSLCSVIIHNKSSQLNLYQSEGRLFGSTTELSVSVNQWFPNSGCVFSVGLTGTKLGCAEGGCGACTVMLSRYRAHAQQLLYPYRVVECGDHGGRLSTTVNILHPCPVIMPSTPASPPSAPYTWLPWQLWRALAAWRKNYTLYR